MFKFPTGNKELHDAIERWKTASGEQEKAKARNVCCLNCPKILECEECIIGMEGEYEDGYAKLVPNGMHGDIYRDANGVYHYCHPYQGG